VCFPAFSLLSHKARAARVELRISAVHLHLETGGIAPLARRNPAKPLQLASWPSWSSQASVLISVFPVGIIILPLSRYQPTADAEAWPGCARVVLEIRNEYASSHFSLFSQHFYELGTVYSVVPLSELTSRSSRLMNISDRKG
jgi:hypothetical protein